MPARPDSGSITSVRGRIAAVVEAEAAGRRGDVVVLAVDGIPFDVAAERWTSAYLTSLRSVFPTTSATGWLSSLTGLAVADHGIPGVAFVEPTGEPINIYSHRGPLGLCTAGNIFTDARAAGYHPLVILGDLEPLLCTWRNLLLEGAETRGGHPFFSSIDAEPLEMGERVEGAIGVVRAESNPEPRLIWCFMDADLYIHRHGYDDGILSFLSDLDRIAMTLMESGAAVMAHSDHGLVPTVHDADLECLLAALAPDFAHPIGGAGRARWLYPAEGRESAIRAALAAALPPDVEIVEAHALFEAGSMAHARVGPLILLATGKRFLSPPGYSHEHGSLTPTELHVPFAYWS
jgi:hypothetical protein